MHYLEYNEPIVHRTGDAPLAFYPVDERHPRYRMRLHWHRETELIRVLRGRLHLYVDDETLAQGKSVTRTAGVYGTRTNTYKVTTKGDKETSRELVESSVIQEPRDAVVARGTKPAWHCYDTTSYDRNPYNDNYCEYSDGSGKYVPDSEARALDPDYTPGKAGAAYYNSF